MSDSAATDAAHTALLARNSDDIANNDRERRATEQAFRDRLNTIENRLEGQR
jgi:hypothetical protein